MLSEKKILNIIKYGPVLPLIILSALITFFSIEDKNEDLKKEIETVKINYLNENKQLVKNEINKVVYLINLEIEKSKETLKKNIKEKVYEAHRVATNIYNSSIENENKNNLTREQIFDTIKYALTGMSYNGNKGYFFIDDINGTKLLQPFNKSFEGKNFLEFEDSKGYKFVKNRIEVIKNKSEAFDSYYWFKPNNKVDLYEKISFYKYFEPYNVSIGTGEYMEDFEKKLKQKVLNWIKRIKDNDDSYIFVYDKDGVCLAHIKEEYIGKNRIDLQDKNGNYILRDILEISKNKKEGFVNYFSSYSGSFDSSDKISYVKLLKKWNWTLGTGFYLDKLNDEIKVIEKELTENKKLLINKILILSAIITLFLILISFYISNIIANRFTNYKMELDNEMAKTIEKEKLLVQHSKLAMMGEMIGNIAHQWKQPLSVISMSNTLLKLANEDVSFSSKEKKDEAIESINNSVMHLSQTIDDFKNFFDPYKEKISFSIEESFEKTFKLVSSQFRDSKIEIVKNIEDIKILGFQNQLLHVLINILKNSRDEVLKSDDKKENKYFIFIDVYKKDNSVIIKIKDTLGGIQEKIINNIFDPYFSTKKKNGGTGIGLYMSKQIVEDHMDGKIEALNVEYEYEGVFYKGAEFTITLPLNAK